MNWSDAAYFLPEAMVVLTFLGCVLADILTKGRNHALTLGVLVVGLLVAGGIALAKPPVGSHGVFGDMVVVDPYAHFFRFVFLGITLLAAAFSWGSREIMGADRENQGEYYGFLAVMCFGMMVMAEAADLLMMVLSIELVSITSYIMAGYARFSLRSTEASLKYVLWGAVSSGFMLYGGSWIFGLTGATTFSGIAESLANSSGNELGVLVGMLFFLAGVGYKISAVPFHFWTPDVYEGSPTPVAAFFAAGPKAAGFALLIRFFYTSLVEPLTPDGAVTVLEQVQWPWILAIMAAVTMTWGNLAALRQTNLKRLLAYSSIAHVGYLLMGFVVLSPTGLQAILFYLLVYAIMTLGAFLVVIALNNRLSSEELGDYEGLGYREPVLGALMTLFMFSLTGLPPTSGFIGKYLLFVSVIEADMWWLALVGAINSVISLAYYMRVPWAMYFSRGEGQGALGLAPVHMVLLWILGIPTLVFGLYWGPLKRVADTSVAYLFGG